MFTNFTAKVATFEDSNDGNPLVKILDIKNGHQQNFQFDSLSFSGFCINRFNKTVIQRYEIVNIKFHNFFDETFKVLMKSEDFDDYCHWRGCGRGKLRNPAELVKVCPKTFGLFFSFNSLMTEILGSTIVAIMYFFHCSI